MKIHKMNKEVHHNGTVYKKGDKIKEDSGDFAVLQKGGHIETHDFSKDVEEPSEGKSEEKSEQPAESKHKSKK